MRRMVRWKWLAALAMAGAVSVSGCDSDDYGDEAFVAADEIEGGDEAAPGYADDEMGEARPSPGPVQGQERPADHPTLEGGEAGGDGGSAQQQGVAAPEVERPSPEEYGEVGPLRWEAPSNWEAQTQANQMRFAEYEVPAKSDADPAELTIFFFGPGGGGGVESNLERWAGEFSDGPEPVRDQREVAGMEIHTLEVKGTRQPSMPMGAGEGAQEEQQLLGAVVEASEGLFFVRLVGDRAVVGGETDSFDEFIESLGDEA